MILRCVRLINDRSLSFVSIGWLKYRNFPDIFCHHSFNHNFSTVIIYLFFFVFLIMKMIWSLFKLVSVCSLWKILVTWVCSLGLTFAAFYLFSELLSEFPLNIFASMHHCSGLCREMDVFENLSDDLMQEKSKVRCIWTIFKFQSEWAVANYLQHKIFIESVRGLADLRQGEVLVEIGQLDSRAAKGQIEQVRTGQSETRSQPFRTKPRARIGHY